MSDEPGGGEAKADNLSAGSSHAHGPPGAAEPYHKQIEAGLRQGLTAQRIYQDLCDQEAYPHKYALVRRNVRRLVHQHPKLLDVMEHPPGEEALCGFPHRASYAASANMRRPARIGLVVRC